MGFPKGALCAPKSAALCASFVIGSEAPQGWTAQRAAQMRPEGAREATEGSYGSRSETMQMRPEGAKEAARRATTAGAGGVERGAQPLFRDRAGPVGSAVRSGDYPNGGASPPETLAGKLV